MIRLEVKMSAVRICERSPDGKWGYFSRASCSTSYSGCMDEHSSLTEQEISEFIRYSNPPLYEKLQGLQVASSYLASDSSDDKPDCVDLGTIQTAASGPTRSCSPPHQAGAENEETAGVFGSENPYSTVPESKATAKLSRPYRVVEPITLDRYLFEFYHHSHADMIYCCSSPTCQYDMNVIPLGDFFGSVRDEALTGENTALTSEERTLYYCLDCLQEVLGREFENDKAHEMLPQLVDGACD